MGVSSGVAIFWFFGLLLTGSLRWRLLALFNFGVRCLLGQISSKSNRTCRNARSMKRLTIDDLRLLIFE
jgi:hypothetical protein